MDQERVPPPDSPSTAPDVRPRAIELTGSIERADVESACARASEAFRGGPPGIVVCRLGGLVDPAMPAVEVLARLALRARRNRQRMRLEHAPPALVELLVLCGLDAVADTASDAGPGDDSVQAGR